MPENLRDRWESRDRPALLELARQLDETRSTLHTGDPDIMAAVVALMPTYLDAKVQRSGGGEPYVATIRGLTDRGRREVGLWPSETAAADALLELLQQAADQVDDEDDAGALRKAGRLLRSVPAAVLADVTAALIRQQTGIG